MCKRVFEIGSEYDWDSNVPYLKEDENDFFASVSKQNVRFLRSGRDAIRYVARLCKEKCQTVLMPALMCSCVPEQFVEEGYKVVYYKVHADFSADMNDIEKKLSANSVFFFMNYFGQPFITVEQIKKIKNRHENIICVEDITHDFLKRRTEEFQSDYTVCSIRKWFAIPDGGMVIGKERFDEVQVEINSYFAELRERAMKQKSTYLNNGIPSEKEEYRTVLATSNDYIDNIDHIAYIQEKSMNILSHIDLKRIYELRVKNVNVLKQEIESLVTTCANSTLYYPIHVGNRQGEVQRKLAEHSIYLPVIWPVPQEAKGVCSVADDVAQSMLAIPCDHRYSVKDMEKIVEVLKECV